MCQGLERISFNRFNIVIARKISRFFFIKASIHLSMNMELPFSGKLERFRKRLLMGLGF